MADDDAVSLPDLADQLMEVKSNSIENARRAVYSELSNSSDSISREIGQQLQAGTLAPYQLLRIPGYDQVIENGLRKLRHTLDALDDESVRAKLADRVDREVLREDQVDQQ